MLTDGGDATGASILISNALPFESEIAYSLPFALAGCHLPKFDLHSDSASPKELSNLAGVRVSPRIKLGK